MSRFKTGSCKCGEVKFETGSEVEMVVNCHCNSCRKMSGAAFSTLCVVDGGGWEFTAGGDQVNAYPATENGTKNFCRQCGSPVYFLNTKLPGKHLIPIGALDDPSGLTPAMNVFCENMLPWVTTLGDIASFDQFPG